MVHTCEDLVTQGLLEREGATGESVLFTWWPTDERSARESSRSRLNTKRCEIM